MSLYANAKRDQRVREYLPAQRIVVARDIANAEIMINNYAVQPSIAGDSQVCRPQAGGFVVLDFGIELHGGIRIVNRYAAGRIRLRFGESVSETMQTPNQDHAIHDTELAIPSMGMLEYGNTAFRFVRVDFLDTPMDIINILAVALYRDLEKGGSFLSSDKRLNQIWDVGAYTLQLNMQDFIYDGAKRDRLVWMGDLHPEVRTLLAVFNDASLVAESLDFVRNHTALPQTMNNITSYSIWWVIIQFEYFLYRGDLTYLAGQQAYLTGLVEQLATYVDDNGSEQVPPRRFLDWPNNDVPQAMHAGLQGLLCWAFACADKLYQALELDPALPRAMHQRMQKHVPDCGDSKAAAAMLTLSGLSDRRDVLLKDPFRGVSTFYGYYMLLAQPNASAVELIRRYWGGMLDYGATTFWEDFDLDWLKNTSPITELPVPGKDDLHADFGNYCYKGLRHSLCHGWASGPTPFLSERILGVKFLTPGGRKIAVKPDLCGLEFVSGSVPTRFGKVKIYCDQSGKLDISAPAEISVEA